MAEKSRRKFLQGAGIAAAALMTGANSYSAEHEQAQTESACTEKHQKIKLGAASFTFKGFTVDEALAMTKRVGLKYICLKRFHLPLDSTPRQIAETITKIKDAGVIPYGCGCVKMNDEEQVNNAFEYARAAGMRIIVSEPAVEMLPVINQKVREYDIQVALHNHCGSKAAYNSPEVSYKYAKKYDKRIGICLDIGHSLRAGVEPSAAVERFADRLLDMHIKDITEAAKSFGGDVPVGRGIVDIPSVLRALIKIEYASVASFEYEKDPQPLAGLAESVGYVRGVLAAI